MPRLPALILPLCMALPAGSVSSQTQEDPGQGIGWETPWPMPRGALLPADDPEPPAMPPQAAAAGEAFPSAKAAGAARAASAVPSMPMHVIRQGLATEGASERVVGLKLGGEIAAISTTMTGAAGGGNTRLGWRLGRPAQAEEGAIWSLGTGGEASVAGAPRQIGDAMIGWRQALREHVVLTSKLGLAGHYVFAAGDGLHSTLTPELGLSTNVAGLARLPFPLGIDLALARQVSVHAGDWQTRGTAMVNLRYTLD